MEKPVKVTNIQDKFFFYLVTVFLLFFNWKYSFEFVEKVLESTQVLSKMPVIFWKI